MEVWQCIICDYRYDPEVGDKDRGIPAGTKFEDFPEDWVCPKNGARKVDFIRMEDVSEENNKDNAKGTGPNKIVWSDEYSVNITEMDKQHMKLVEIINNHSSAVDSKEEREILKDRLKGLLKYIDLHFKTEEKLLQQHDFPEYMDHKKKHDHLSRKVNALYTKYLKGDESTAAMVSSLMKDWLFDHICNEDKKYGKYLSSNGVT